MTVSTPLIQTIELLQKRIRSYLEQRHRPNEDDTIRIFILPLLTALGWNIEDWDEVKGQYRHRSSDNPVDYALWLQGSPVLFVEAKSLTERLEDRKWVVQTLNYANTAGVDWCVLTNGNEYRYYKTHAKGEAENKLFLTAKVDSDESVANRAAKFALISRDCMRQRDIDARWTNSRTDTQIQNILENLLEDDSLVRLVQKRSNGLRPKEIRQSLQRASIRVDYPDIGEALDNGESEAISVIPPIRSKSKKKGLPRTKDLFERGLLKKGMMLSIRNHAGSDASVTDGNTVEFRGERMSFHAWGCRATGWSAIQIYAHAVTEDGRLLQELRQQAIDLAKDSE